MGYTACVVHWLSESFPLKVNYLHHDLSLKDVRIFAISYSLNQLAIVLRDCAQNIQLVANLNLILLWFVVFPSIHQSILFPVLLIQPMVVEHFGVIISQLEHGQIVSSYLVVTVQALPRPLIVIELVLENITLEQFEHRNVFVDHLDERLVEEVGVFVRVLMPDNVVYHQFDGPELVVL